MALSKRTHIMLDPQMFEWLKNKADVRGVTFGSVVRSYLEEKLQAESDKIKNDRLKFFARLKRLHKEHPIKGTLNYRELIEYGRKY